MSQLQEAQSRLASAKGRAAPVAHHLKKDKLDAQEVIRAVMAATEKKPNTAQRETLAYLSEQGGMGDDLVRQAQDLKVKTAFQGGNPNGSRMVNLMRSAGRAAGAKAGPAAQKVMEFGGGLVGATLDYSAGKVAKAALDASAVASSAIPPVVRALIQTNIDKLNASQDPKAKRYLQALDSAAQRNPDALAVAHTLMSKDPEFLAMTEGTE